MTCIKNNCQWLMEIEATGAFFCSKDGVAASSYINRGKCVLDMSKYEAKKVKAAFYDSSRSYIETFGQKAYDDMRQYER